MVPMLYRYRSMPSLSSRCVLSMFGHTVFTYYCIKTREDFPAYRAKLSYIVLGVGQMSLLFEDFPFIRVSSHTLGFPLFCSPHMFDRQMCSLLSGRWDSSHRWILCWRFPQLQCSSSLYLAFHLLRIVRG